MKDTMRMCSAKPVHIGGLRWHSKHMFFLNISDARMLIVRVHACAYGSASTLSCMNTYLGLCDAISQRVRQHAL